MRKPIRTIKAKLVTVLPRPRTAVERGQVIRVQSFVSNGVTYSVESANVNGSTQPQNMEPGVYALRYRDLNRCQYDFFLVDDTGSIETLGDVSIAGITDGRIPAGLFDAKLLAVFQTVKTRRHLQIINAAE